MCRACVHTGHRPKCLYKYFHSCGCSSTKKTTPVAARYGAQIHAYIHVYSCCLSHSQAVLFLINLTEMFSVIKKNQNTSFDAFNPILVVKIAAFLKWTPETKLQKTRHGARREKSPHWCVFFFLSCRISSC